jgi:hypothetical protein
MNKVRTLCGSDGILCVYREETGNKKQKKIRWLDWKIFRSCALAKRVTLMAEYGYDIESVGMVCSINEGERGLYSCRTGRLGRQD